MKKYVNQEFTTFQFNDPYYLHNELDSIKRKGWFIVYIDVEERIVASRGLEDEWSEKVYTVIARRRERKDED